MEEKLKYYKDKRFEGCVAAATQYKYFYKSSHIFFIEVKDESIFYSEEELKKCGRISASIYFAPSSNKSHMQIDTPNFHTHEELYAFIKEKFGQDCVEE